MIGSFKNFLVEEEKTVFFTWGRMNPPTIGHEKLLTALSRKAGNNPYFVYLSQSTDPKKNPLPYKDKIKIARKMFPRYARRIMLDAKIRNLFDILTKLYDMGYKNVTMVVGADRVQEFDILMNKYNGKKGRHGFYNFRSMNVLSAGDRDPDAEGATGMSASKMRAAAGKGDFTSFSQGLPKTFSNADAKNLFNTVRRGMGLKEQREYKNHIQLNPISETREQYVTGDLYAIGDKVIVRESDEVGEVIHLGANYVIVEKNNTQKRYWLDAIELVERDYAKEYANYQGKPEQIARRSSRNQARRIMGDKAVKGMDVGHKDNNPMNNDPSNLRNEDPSKNRREPRLRLEVPQDQDIKDKKGTQPKKYFKGLSKSTKSARDAHFKKGKNKADNDSSAYKPAPGDANAKTKPSKYTKAFKDMYDDTRMDKIKTRIDREKAADKIKHDRMQDRARLRDVLKKNRETK